MAEKNKKFWQNTEHLPAVLTVIGMIFAAGVTWNRAEAAIDKVAEIDAWKQTTQKTITDTARRVEDIAEFIGVPHRHRGYDGQ